MSTATAFVAVPACWVCGGAAFSPVHDARFELSRYAQQDPELAAYTGAQVTLQRCHACGFAQPAALPSLPRYFDRMYDQRWSDDWIVNEHEAAYKDRIFDDILTTLERRVTAGRTLLDIGAHAGRFLRLARQRGWQAEGLELNPKTAAYAARTSGSPVHHGSIQAFTPQRCYDAITLTDVLEHVPEPITILTRVRSLLCPDGCVAIKVPNGDAQRIKETWRARLKPSYRATLADNLVHVNHFSAASLSRALRAAGFQDVTIVAAVPEFPDDSVVDRLIRELPFRLARIVPAGASLPVALNLQAYGRA